MARPSMLAALAISVLGCAPIAAPSGASFELATTAETSGWLRTGRYPEAVRLCRELARAFPRAARCEVFGLTPEGREMVALVASADGVLSADEAERRRRPVVLVQAGIHAGEIEGKDAGLVLLRDLLERRLGDALSKVTVVFVPVANPDGHERFGPSHRVNQRGPEEMGFRTTAQNLNLNRDYLKVDTPEMAALLDLFGRWDPVLYVDLHTTDGAKFEHDVALLVAPLGARPDGLERVASSLSEALRARLETMGHLPIHFYPSFVEPDDPASGFAMRDAPPRFSQAYAAARNRLGLLVETHSWRTYRERAQATRDVLTALLELAADQGEAWRSAVDRASVAAASLGGTKVVLLAASNDNARTIDFRGYAYEKRPSDISGGTWLVYDERSPQIWRIPLRDELVPVLTVAAPRGGYAVPAPYAALVAPRLDHHQIRYVRTRRSATLEDAELFRADAVTFSPPTEGRTRATMTGAWHREAVTLVAGALWVPISQPAARLVLHLFEPTAPDSLAAWGYFNAVFEQKEYMEPYVAEQVARDMLAADPTLRAEFDAWLAVDPARAASAEARLDFFYRRHPSWDRQKDRLPIVKLDATPPDLGME